MGDTRKLDVPLAEKQETQPGEGHLREDAYGASPGSENNGAGSDKISQQLTVTTTVKDVDNPYIHLQKAVELFDPRDPAKLNAKSAEIEWKKAIEAADKLPTDDYKVKLAEIDAKLKTESDPLRSQEMLKFREGLRELSELPLSLRLEMATFYLQNAKPDQAKELLTEAAKLNPSLKEQERFKQLAAISEDNSSGKLDKTIGFLKSTGKELLSDGIAGGAGLVAFSLVPGGRLLKVGSALLAGGATKHGLSLAGLGGDANAPLKNFAWGGVDALAMVSGAAVREKMMGTFEKSLTSDALKGIASKGGITGAELAAFEGKFAANHMGGYREAAVMIEGKNGVGGLKTATEMLAANVAEKRIAYRQELWKAIRSAPIEQRPALWLQASMPGMRGIPNPRLTAVEAARKEYMAARGSSFDFLNPMNMFRHPTQYNGTLKNLEAITFWNRYKMDAVGIAGSSFIYRGSHEAMKVGDIDPATGQKYSAYDAIANTMKATTSDALLGALTVGMIRPMLPAVNKFTGNLGPAVFEKLPSTVRTGLAAIPTSAALYSNELNDAYVANERASDYEKIRVDIQKPLEDKNPK